MRRYKALLQKIRKLSGAREDESVDALEVVVETVAAHLDDYSRQGFASRLPMELQSAAQMVPTITHIDENIIDQLMNLDDVDERTARRRLKAAWHALIELFDPESVEDIRKGLPQHVKAVLH